MHGSFLRGSRHGSANGSRSGSRHGFRQGKRNDVGTDARGVADTGGAERATSSGTETRCQMPPGKDADALDTLEQQLVADAESERNDTAGVVVKESPGLQKAVLVVIEGAVGDDRQAEVAARTDRIRMSIEIGSRSPVARRSAEPAFVSEPGESGQVVRPPPRLPTERNTGVSAGADLTTTNEEASQEGLAPTGVYGNVDAPTDVEANGIVANGDLQLRTGKVDMAANNDSQHGKIAAEAPASGEARRAETSAAGQEQHEQVRLVPITFPDRVMNHQLQVIFVWYVGNRWIVGYTSEPVMVRGE